MLFFTCRVISTSFLISLLKSHATCRPYSTCFSPDDTINKISTWLLHSLPSTLTHIRLLSISLTCNHKLQGEIKLFTIIAYLREAHQNSFFWECLVSMMLAFCRVCAKIIIRTRRSRNRN